MSVAMTPRHIALVQASWRQVQPIAGAAAALFYARLFDVEPSVRPLFTADLQDQGRKLTTMISVAVSSLEHLDGLVPVLQALGRRHVRYGVEERHYALVGDTLIWTLKRGLGAAFTRDVEEAWRAAYGVLASIMKDASERSPELHGQRRDPALA